MTKEEMKTKALAILGYDETTPLSGIEICYKKINCNTRTTNCYS